MKIINATDQFLQHRVKHKNVVEKQNEKKQKYLEGNRKTLYMPIVIMECTFSFETPSFNPISDAKFISSLRKDTQGRLG